MKKKILTVLLLAGALLVVPFGDGFLSTVVTASTNSTVNSEVTDLIGNVTSANAVDVANVVRTYPASGIGEAMVSGETELVNKMADLEAAYKQALGIPDTTVSVSGVSGIEASQVKVLGAALNTTTGAALSIKPAEQSVEVPSEYSNAHLLEISMAGLNRGGIPMMITMPVPSGMDINKVVVLHYVTRGHWDENSKTWVEELVPEALTTVNNGDGTISFFVTHFSTFAFVEGDGVSESAESDTEVKTEQDEIVEWIENANSGDVIRIKNVTALSNGVMQALLKKGDVTLVMEYTYENVNYVVTIPASAAVNADIPWYGPLYLAGHYANGAVPAGTAAGASYTVQSGDTMGKIARANGMTLRQLAEKNPGIKNLDYIVVGQKINVK